MTIVELDLLAKSAGFYGITVTGGYVARPENVSFYPIRVENDILTFYRCISYIKKYNYIRPNLTKAYKVMLADADPKKSQKIWLNI